MDEYDVTDLSDEDLLIVITSTAHNSQPPPTGEVSHVIAVIGGAMCKRVSFMCLRKALM